MIKTAAICTYRYPRSNQITRECIMQINARLYSLPSGYTGDITSMQCTKFTCRQVGKFRIVYNAVHSIDIGNQINE